MGAGDIFRGVAQSLLAGVGGAGQYALNQKAEDRKLMHDLLVAHVSKTSGGPTNAAEIALQAANNDPNKAIEILKQLQPPQVAGFTYVTDANGNTTAVPISKTGSTQITTPPGGSVTTPSGNPVVKEKGFGQQILDLIKPNLTTTPDQTAPTSIIPHKLPGETKEQYTTRTGIKVK